MKEETLKYAGISIIVLLLITTTIAFVSNSKNKRNYNEEKTRNESVSLQRLMVSQELDKAKSDMAALTTIKQKEDKAMAETDSKMKEAETRIANLSKENGSLLKDRNSLAQLQKSKNALDNAYEDLKLKQKTASSRINELENSAIILDAQKNELSEILENEEEYRTSNMEIYGSRGTGKDKLTFLARRTKKLNLIFDVPQGLNKPFSINILTPNGKTITPDGKSLLSLIEPEVDHLTASLSDVPPSEPGKPDASQRVILTYTPEEKLNAGEYKIQIFSNGKNIGNCRLKLR